MREYVIQRTHYRCFMFSFPNEVSVELTMSMKTRNHIPFLSPTSAVLSPALIAWGRMGHGL